MKYLMKYLWRFVAFVILMLLGLIATIFMALWHFRFEKNKILSLWFELKIFIKRGKFPQLDEYPKDIDIFFPMGEDIFSCE